MHYITVTRHLRFHRAVLDKFRILGLVEYRRVLLMDGDVMPIASLDYLFEMSDGENATLKENLITAGKMEPANAVSLFLLYLYWLA
jgi:alpha-N-acetylglucosamine transferase